MSRDYRVSLHDRLKALVFTEDGDYTLGPESEFTYSWSNGYEVLTEKQSSKTGSSEYRGVYHPDEGYCEGEHICIHCGRTLF